VERVVHARLDSAGAPPRSINGRAVANREETMTTMKTIVLAVSLSLIASSAFATCKSDAEGKKLAGAALRSFMTKCEKDANTACTADSTAKKLAGAAKTSHMKKCVTDATGT
jgi:uncharacterized membrane protein